MGRTTARKYWVPLLVGIGLAAGCASGPNVHFRSIPSSVEVVDLGNNELLGMTPVDGSWGGKKDKPRLVTVRFQKIGYQDRIETFSDKGKELTIAVEMKEED